MARKTTGRNPKAGSGPVTDDTAAETTSGTEQSLTPEVAKDQPLTTPEVSEPADTEPPAQVQTGSSETSDTPVPPAESEPQNLAEPDSAADPEPETLVPEAQQETADQAEATLSRSDDPAMVGEQPVPGTDSAAPSEAATDQNTPARETAPLASPPPPASASGGFFPLLLGGIVAGGIGYGVHYAMSQGTGGQASDIAALQAEISELRTALAAAPDLSGLEAELADLRAAVSAPLAAVESLDVAGQIAAEIDALRAEFAQGDTGAAQAEVMTRLNQLAEDLSGTTARLEGLESDLAARGTQIAAIQNELAEIRDLAEGRLAEAETALDTALARAGLDMLRAALSTGAPYPEALGLLRDAGVTVPETLAANAPAGVRTLEMLQETFPAAARAALRAALQDMPADSTAERIANFLRAQVGARSTAPRDGDDPDAVLSRAGAALEAGSLEAALAELDALPEPALAAMQDWRRAAQARHDAEAEFETFATTLSTQ